MITPKAPDWCGQAAEQTEPTGMQNRVSDAVRAASTPDKTLHTALSALMRPIRGIREHPPARYFFETCRTGKTSDRDTILFSPLPVSGSEKPCQTTASFGLLSNRP